MKDINELRDINYLMGWSFIGEKHIDLESGSCCPLAMYLLTNGLINRDASWLQTIRAGNQIFDREELDGFLHSIIGRPMKLGNYNSIKKYSKGYLAGKECRERLIKS